MDVTTIYSSASGEPVMLIAGLAGIAAAIILAAVLVKYDYISLIRGSVGCPGITS